MVNTIPDYLVVSSRGDTSPHSEDQLAIEGFLQQQQYLVALLVVRQVGHTVRAGEVHIAPAARVHVVVDDDSATVGLALAFGHVAYRPCHGACRLVAYHPAENGGAHWAADPVLVPKQASEALIMHDMRAFQHDEISLVVAQQLFFHLLGGLGLVLELTDAALLVLWFLPGQLELKRGIVRELNLLRNLELLVFLLVAKHEHPVLNVFSNIAFLFNEVVLVQLNFVLVALDVHLVERGPFQGNLSFSLLVLLLCLLALGPGLGDGLVLGGCLGFLAACGARCAGLLLHVPMKYNYMCQKLIDSLSHSLLLIPYYPAILNPQTTAPNAPISVSIPRPRP